MGNLTRDPEVTYTASNLCIAKAGLAINERVKRNNEWADEVLFVDFTVFGKSAEVFAEYAKKGSQVYVGGKLKLDQWDDKNTGQKRTKLNIIADRIQFLGRRETVDSTGDDEQPQSTRPSKQREPKAKVTSTDDSDIPFSWAIAFTLISVASQVVG